MNRTSTRRASLPRRLLWAVLALATVAAACTGSDTESAEHQEFQRIVSISPTGTEILFAIGVGDRVVAVDQFSYYPPEAPVTDLDGWNPNIEAIAAYEPDLVVLQTDGDLISGLEALGIAVLAHDAPFVFDDVYAQIAQFGEVTGQVDEAAQLAADMGAQIADLIAAAPDASGSELLPRARPHPLHRHERHVHRPGLWIVRA